MDIVRALKFPFDDNEWMVKTVIGSLMMLVAIIFPPIFLGYQVVVARRVMRGSDRPLPGSEDLGQILTDGIMATIATLVYLIPILPLLCVMGVVSSLSGDDAGALFALCITGGISLLLIPYGLLVSVVSWAGMIRYAETGNFSSFVQFRTLLSDVRDNLGTFVTLMLYYLLLGLIASIVAPLSLITCVGIFVVIFFSQTATGHLIGQAGRMVHEGI